MYLNRIPKSQLNKIFKGFKSNIIYIETAKPIHLVDKSLLKKCAEQLYEEKKII